MATINNSVQLQLSLLLSALIFLLALAAGSAIYLTELEDATLIQDEQLHHMAIAANQKSTAFKEATHNPVANTGTFNDHIFVQQLGIQRQLRKGEPRLPENLPEGFQTLTIDGLVWRVYVDALNSPLKIAFFQAVSMRNYLAREKAIKASIPILIALPLVIFLVHLLLARLFKPMRLLASNINAHHDQRINPIGGHDLPHEIKPLIDSVNQMMIRVAENVLQQKRFVDDASHELRTSLAALMLQAESLEAAELSDTGKKKVGALRERIQRASDLQSQLLALARTQDTPTIQAHPVLALPVFRQVVEDLIPLADAKDIDLGIAHYDEHPIAISETDLFVLVKNLVDNAIRYTPLQGKVDISASIKNNSYVLTVSDSGPGIPEDEKQKVFDPFYRVTGQTQPGTGLGLAIVKSIASRANARIHIQFTDQVEKTGLRVSLAFPL